MSAIAVTLERRPTVPLRVRLTYALIVTILIVLFLTIQSIGSTTAGTPPTPRPQSGPPVTTAAPASARS
jgi:hypothetical protein